MAAHRLCEPATFVSSERARSAVAALHAIHGTSFAHTPRLRFASRSERVVAFIQQIQLVDRLAPQGPTSAHLIRIE
jgi:hypothetical protein